MDASAAGLESGDRVYVVAEAYTDAALAKYQSRGISTVIEIDLTPPEQGVVTITEPCDPTSQTCPEDHEARSGTSLPAVVTCNSVAGSLQFVNLQLVYLAGDHGLIAANSVCERVV